MSFSMSQYDSRKTSKFIRDTMAKVGYARVSISSQNLHLHRTLSVPSQQCEAGDAIEVQDFAQLIDGYALQVLCRTAQPPSLRSLRSRVASSEALFFWETQPPTKTEIKAHNDDNRWTITTDPSSQMHLRRGRNQQEAALARSPGRPR